MAPSDRALLAAMAREAGDARARLDHAASALGEWVGALPDDLRAGALGGAQAFDEIGQRLMLARGLRVVEALAVMPALAVSAPHGVRGGAHQNALQRSRHRL